MYIKYTICIYFGYVLLAEVKATETHTIELKRLLQHFLKSTKATVRRLAVKKSSFQIPVVSSKVTSQRKPHLKKSSFQIHVVRPRVTSQRKSHWKRFAAYALSFDQLHKMALKKGRMRSPLVNQMARDVQLMKNVVKRMKDHHVISSVISISKRMKGYALLSVRRMKENAPSSVISKPIFKTSSREIKTTGGTPSLPLRKIFLEHYEILTKITEGLLDSN